MSKKDMGEVAFWTAVMLAVIAWGLYALFGCAEAAAETSPAATIPPMEVVERSDELAQQHRSHEIEAVEAGKLDIEGEPIDAPADDADGEGGTEEGGAWAETGCEPACERYGGYAGGSTATTTHDLLDGQGRAVDGNGTSYTWYYNDIGWGSIEDRIPGCHYDDDGVAYDGDGYIAVASSDHASGTVIDTPYGEAKVYDTGCASGTVDIYTNR